MNGQPADVSSVELDIRGTVTDVGALKSGEWRFASVTKPAGHDDKLGVKLQDTRGAMSGEPCLNAGRLAALYYVKITDQGMECRTLAPLPML